MPRLMEAAGVYPMAQAVLFGIGLIAALVLAPGLSAQNLIPGVVATTALISLPVSWMIAPRMMARYHRGRAATPLTPN